MEGEPLDLIWVRPLHGHDATYAAGVELQGPWGTANAKENKGRFPEKKSKNLQTSSDVRRCNNNYALRTFHGPRKRESRKNIPKGVGQRYSIIRIAELQLSRLDNSSRRASDYLQNVDPDGWAGDLHRLRNRQRVLDNNLRPRSLENTENRRVIWLHKLLVLRCATHWHPREVHCYCFWSTSWSVLQRALEYSKSHGIQKWQCNFLQEITSRDAQHSFEGKDRTVESTLLSG